MSEKIYAWLLRLYPACFRKAYGEEAQQLFRDRARDERGFLPRLRLWLDLLGDLLVSLPREYRHLPTSALATPAANPGGTPSFHILEDEAPSLRSLLYGGILSLAICGSVLFAIDHGRKYFSVPDPSFQRRPSYAGSPTPAPPGAAASATVNSGAQTELKPELLLFHPSGPPLSYEVATIKPLDPEAASGMVKLPPGGSLNPLSIRRYIMDAYGATYAAQVAGGPDWLNKDSYLVHGKVPDDLEAAAQKMTTQERVEQNRSMQQSLLADRFHLKAHFETQVLPVYELVPAKGGLKITEVPAPPERKPGDPGVRPQPGEKLSPGSSTTTLSSNGLRVLNGRAIQMQLLARILGGDAGDRPIVNHTGFTGYFDVTDLTWAPLGDANADSAPDAPSLTMALEKTLGIKLVPGKAPIEVLVIDHIERPSGN